LGYIVPSLRSYADCLFRLAVQLGNLYCDVELVSECSRKHDEIVLADPLHCDFITPEMRDMLRQQRHYHSTSILVGLRNLSYLMKRCERAFSNLLEKLYRGSVIVSEDWRFLRALQAHCENIIAVSGLVI